MKYIVTSFFIGDMLKAIGLSSQTSLITEFKSDG